VFSKTGHLAICSDCRNCTECCCCENSFFPSGVRVLHRPSLNFHPYNPKDKISRYIGVEIEVSESNPDDGEHIFETLTKWGCAAVHDGSLPETGYEINTAPAKGEVFEKEINAVCAALKVANAKVNSSCGLHVHIDCRDLNFYDLKKTILVYSKVEESLFRMLAKSRTTNHYCQKINKKFDKILIEKDKNWRKNLLEQTYGSNSLGIREARRDKYNEARYYALNIHSWFYRKTLEFRQHQGTVDPKKIINWAKICQSIVNFAVKHSEREIEKHFQNVPIELRLPTILTEDLKDYYFSRVNLFHRPKKIEDTPELVMADTNNTIVVQNESVWTVPNENYTLTLNTATNSNDDLF
jgi:hypothetical protein